MVTDREQILIAGAGPVGLVAALQLARMGRPVRIVDARQVSLSAVKSNRRQCQDTGTVGSLPV